MNFGRVCGLAVGAWGEISEDFNCLMDVMGEKKIEEFEAQTGRHVRKSVTAQLASYISHNRQQLSQICVKSQARLVLDRLEGLGGGTGGLPAGEDALPGWRGNGRRRGMHSS